VVDTEDLGGRADAEPEETFLLVERVVSPYLVAFHRPLGPQAEQYRALRNKIMAMNRAGLSRVVLITSAMPGDGKSVTAGNLAAVLGELERTPVLLVDADLRRPGLERLLGLTSRAGLADLLQGAVPLEDAVRPSVLPGVDLLGAGTPIPHPGGLLASSRIRDLFAALKERYRYVLVDSPPALPVTDAAALAPQSDGVLLVVRLDHTPRPAVERTLSLLRGVGGAVLGVFITGVKGRGAHGAAPYPYPYEGRPGGAS